MPYFLKKNVQFASSLSARDSAATALSEGEPYFDAEKGELDAEVAQAEIEIFEFRIDWLLSIKPF